MQITAVIPARLDSSSLPRKPLLDVAGQPLIAKTIEAVSGSMFVDSVIVVADSTEIIDAVHDTCVSVLVADGWCGTDRICQAMKSGFVPGDLIVNIPCDEPMLDPNDLDALIVHMKGKAQDDPRYRAIGTLVAPIGHVVDLSRQHIVKADMYFGMCVSFGRSEWFSAPYHHVGVYAYYRHTLQRIAKMSQTKRSKKKRLEQLTWIDNGMCVDGVEITDAPLAINTQEDYHELMQRIK